MSAGEQGSRSDHDAFQQTPISDELAAVADDLKSSAAEHARTLVDNAKHQAANYADERKADAAKAVIEAAATLREKAGSLPGGPIIEVFADKAAEHIERLASDLRERSFADLYAEAEDYARRSPLLVGAAAMAAGFLLARFIKSSAEDMQDAAEESRAARTARAKQRATAEA